MNLPAVLLGVVLVGVAGYIISDPMTRSRNWVDGREWERNPQAAREKQVRHTISAAFFIGMLGLGFLVLGLVTG